MMFARLLRHNRCFCVLCCCLLLLLNACDSSSSVISPTPTKSATKPITTPTLSPTAKGDSDCPPPGTARPATLPPLIVGNHQNIVYRVNEFRPGPGSVNQPTFGTLKRYDIATGQKTEIIKQPGVEIDDAQVSADGQWLLFVTITATQAKLQLIRIDGKALQTLYCSQPSSNSTEAAFSLADIQWSFDQKRVVFLSQSTTLETLYLLNMQSGSLQTELSGTRLPSVLTWLDSTRLYLVNPGVDAPPTHLYLLDTNHAAPQSVTQLQSAYSSGTNIFCWDAASNSSGSQLFLSQCTSDKIQASPSSYPMHGPSTIALASPTGGSLQTIFTSARLGIRTLRVIDTTRLLFFVKSTSYHVDTSQNGLWKVNTDGTGLTFLAPNSDTLLMSLNRDTQYPWSNVSRDSTLYSLQTQQLNPPGTPTYTLLYDSLQGGSPTVFASIADGTTLDTVGWITF